MMALEYSDFRHRVFIPLRPELGAGWPETLASEPT
jgi:hypothetical protein